MEKMLLKHHQKMKQKKIFPVLPLWNYVARPPLKSKGAQRQMPTVYEQLNPWPEDQKHLRLYVLEAAKVLQDS